MCLGDVTLSAGSWNVLTTHTILWSTHFARQPVKVLFLKMLIAITLREYTSSCLSFNLHYEVRGALLQNRHGPKTIIVFLMHHVSISPMYVVTVIPKITVMQGSSMRIINYWGSDQCYAINAESNAIFMSFGSSYRS